MNWRIWQTKFQLVRDNEFFQWIVISVIVISSLTIGARTYNVDNHFEEVILYWLDKFITIFFLVEIIIRILAEKKWYQFFHYKEGWNWFDIIIVIGSLMPLNDGSYVLLGRLLRLFRVMRLISFIPQLRTLTSALLIAVPRMGYVALMMFVIFYMYATLGSLLYESINPVLWGDVGRSMLTLFRVSTFEDWTDVMYETMVVYPYSWTYYISFIFLSAFVFLNMMIGIIINVLDEEYQKDKQVILDKENLEKNQGIENQLQQISKQLNTLQQKIDIKNNLK